MCRVPHFLLGISRSALHHVHKDLQLRNNCKYIIPHPSVLFRSFDIRVLVFNRNVSIVPLIVKNFSFSYDKRFYHYIFEKSWGIQIFYLNFKMNIIHSNFLINDNVNHIITFKKLHAVILTVCLLNCETT